MESHHLTTCTKRRSSPLLKHACSRIKVFLKKDFFILNIGMSLIIVNRVGDEYCIHLVKREHKIIWRSSEYLPRRLLIINGEEDFVRIAYNIKYLKPSRRDLAYYRMIIYPIIYQLVFNGLDVPTTSITL
jgi:hypothetical protein